MITDRRSLLALLAGSLATPGLARAASTTDAAMSRVTAYAFSFAGLDGGDIRLAEHAGKPILIVNTASLCGYTPQYAGLQQLWTRYRERGLMIIGVPSNDFGGQEPGGATEIEQTAHQQYGVTFPIAAKADVNGAERASVLQMGGDRAAARGAALEFPQIPDRPRRPHRRRRSRPRSSRWMRASSTRWSRNLAVNRPRGRLLPFSKPTSGKNTPARTPARSSARRSWP